ncbi:MAG TPA: hypothetical protein VK929_14130 [Longimicrobiales bacterium]|nr:hypothetical protein [Longimicrobiales bacterium]
MIRSFAIAGLMTAALVTGATGQHTVGVSAVVVEAFAVPALEVQWHAAEAGAIMFTVSVPDGGAAGRVVERVWLGRAVVEPQSTSYNGSWRLTGDGVEWSQGAGSIGVELVDVLEGGVGRVDHGAGGLVLVRVIASNS